MQYGPATHLELRAPASGHQERTLTMSMERTNQKIAGEKVSVLREHIDDYMASVHQK
jgi:hypothetical protein